MYLLGLCTAARLFAMTLCKERFLPLPLFLPPHSSRCWVSSFIPPVFLADFSRLPSNGAIGLARVFALNDKDNDNFLGDYYSSKLRGVIPNAANKPAVFPVEHPSHHRGGQ